MKRRQTPTKREWIEYLLTGAIVFLITTSALGIDEALQNPIKTPNRPDIFKIDIMKTYGDLERPVVFFFHDQHTATLEKKNKDCLTCHKSVNDKLSIKFMRLEDTDKQSVMDNYHSNCIKCHTEMSAEGDKSGPITCGECHLEKPTIISSRQPIGLDKSLHYRHTKSFENKCEKCHHEYDKETKKLFYKKGAEGTCRYCHKQETEENRISIQLASHDSCINCHLKTLKMKKEAGPVKCEGCHDLKKQQLIRKVVDIPRMERDQPDFILMKTGDKELDLPQKSRMNLVPFNHKMHEDNHNTCRVCHHAGMTPCSKCHTITGSQDGKNINLQKAIHMATSEQGCQGCHKINQKDKACLGCHSFLDKKIEQKDSSCVLCHVNIPNGLAGSYLTQGDGAAIAEQLLNARNKSAYTYTDEDIPEKLTISVIADKYEAVNFPHREILNALLKDIKEKKLANYFHNEKFTLCQGCHHNSPASNKPSHCINCHAIDFDKNDPLKPSLKAAYHQQCMGCHANMEINKMGCTDCHKEKVNYLVEKTSLKRIKLR